MGRGYSRSASACKESAHTAPTCTKVHLVSSPADAGGRTMAPPPPGSRWGGAPGVTVLRRAECSQSYLVLVEVGTSEAWLFVSFPLPHPHKAQAQSGSVVYKEDNCFLKSAIESDPFLLNARPLPIILQSSLAKSCWPVHMGHVFLFVCLRVFFIFPAMDK